MKEMKATSVAWTWLAINGMALLMLFPASMPGDLFIVAAVALSVCFMLTVGRSRQYPVYRGLCEIASGLVRIVRR